MALTRNTLLSAGLFMMGATTFLSFGAAGFLLFKALILSAALTSLGLGFYSLLADVLNERAFRYQAQECIYVQAPEREFHFFRPSTWRIFRYYTNPDPFFPPSTTIYNMHPVSGPAPTLPSHATITRITPIPASGPTAPSVPASALPVGANVTGIYPVAGQGPRMPPHFPTSPSASNPLPVRATVTKIIPITNPGARMMEKPNRPITSPSVTHSLPPGAAVTRVTPVAAAGQKPSVLASALPSGAQVTGIHTVERQPANHKAQPLTFSNSSVSNTYFPSQGSTSNSRHSYTSSSTLGAPASSALPPGAKVTQVTPVSSALPPGAKITGSRPVYK